MTRSKRIIAGTIVAATISTIAACSPVELKPDASPDYLQRDIREDVFYFVMPDRFANGDTRNDLGDAPGSLAHGGFGPDKTGLYHGGDLAGLQSKLDYLENLGVTAIWMTPILKNRAMQGKDSGYHGYWIIDFTAIDPHLGSNAELKTLIKEAHKRNIKVFFDIITNHTADVIRYRECHNNDGSFKVNNGKGCQYISRKDTNAGKGYTPFIPEGQQNIKTPLWLNDPDLYNNQGDSFWEGESAVYGDFAGLDDLNTADPRVVSGFIDIYKDIVREFRPDGFRIDTVKHVDMAFWQQFSPAITEYAQSIGIPNFHLFGEVYSFSPAFLSRYTEIGDLPSVLDFAQQQAIVDYVVKQDGAQAYANLIADDDFYSQPDLLFSFTGNHDMGRIGYFIKQYADDKPAGTQLAMSELAYALLFFSRGIPVIYYGDEQGFTGDGNDQAAREDMMPSNVDSYNDNDLLGTDKTTAEDNFDPSHPLYGALSLFSSVKKSHPTLSTGTQITRYAKVGSPVYAFARIDMHSPLEYLLVFNSAETPQTISLDATSNSYEQLLSHGKTLKAKQGKITVDVPALSFVILRANNKAESSDIKQISLQDVKTVGDGYIELDYQIDLANKPPVVLLTVSTQVKNEQGVWQTIATDTAPPYRARIHRDKKHFTENSTIRVIVQNAANETKMIEIALSE